MTEKTIQLQDQNIYPDDEVLKDVLGELYPVYESLLDLYKANEMKHEWRFYNDGKAWLCKVQNKKRTIVWMSIWDGYISAGIYFPLRLLDEVLALDIDDAVKEKIQNTKNVGKSKPCIFDLQHTDQLADLEKVMVLKINKK